MGTRAGMDFSGPPIGYWKESDPDEYERLMKNKYGDNWNTEEAMKKEAIPGQIIDTPFSSKFAEMQEKEDMSSQNSSLIKQTVFDRAQVGDPVTSKKESVGNKMVDVLGEVDDDADDTIITKIVSKTNKKGLEKLSAIEEEESKDEEDDDNETKSVSS